MSERIIRTPFEDRARCYCDHGRRFADKMQLVDHPDGGRHLEKVGETDIYAKIQSYRDGCDLQKILERCMMTGDYSALQKMQGTYADITGFDADPRKIRDILNHAKFIYEGLDKKTKAHFGDFDGFLETFANSENLSKYLGLNTPIETSTESEVAADES